MAQIHINWVAIVIVVVANFILGFLWYTPLFGKAWAREMKMDMTQRLPTSVFVRGLVINLIGNFLMAFVFAHNIAAWDPTTWGREAVPEMTGSGMAIPAAMFTWAGFFLPLDLNTVAWEGRSWKFFFINTTYHLLSLFVAAFILVYMK